VDARQPHELFDASALLGIGDASEPVIIDIGVFGVDPSCWSLCETDDGGNAPNSIVSVADNGDGTYMLVLSRPITAAAVTTISYLGDDSSVQFISHPSNANADGFSTAVDIIDLIDYLNNIASPPMESTAPTWIVVEPSVDQIFCA